MEDKLIYLRPEIGAESPLWTEHGLMIWLESMPITPRLRTRLENIARYAYNAESDEETADMIGAVTELREQLGPSVEIYLDMR